MELAAVRAVSEQAPRVAGKMNPQAVSNILWVWAQRVGSISPPSSTGPRGAWCSHGQKRCTPR